MADKSVRSTVVLKEVTDIPNIGEFKLEFTKPDGSKKTLTVAEYLKMMVELSQCGVETSLTLTFTANN